MATKNRPAAHAGGTLPRPAHLDQPGNPRRMWLIFEMALVFLAMPLAVIQIIARFNLSLFTVLQPVLLVFVIVLLIDRSFLLRRELTRGFSAKDTLSIFAIFLIAGGGVAAFVAQELPQLFLSFPKRRPETWQLVMIFYPLLSVIVQELVFRTFFFHRYGPIFGEHRFVLIVVNGLLFGFAHLMFGNWIAVGGTAAAGILFAYRYETTRSFWAVWLEHTLWGWFVFTVGLGGFFFTGNSNF